MKVFIRKPILVIFQLTCTNASYQSLKNFHSFLLISTCLEDSKWLQSHTNLYQLQLKSSQTFHSLTCLIYRLYAKSQFFKFYFVFNIFSIGNCRFWISCLFGRMDPVLWSPNTSSLLLPVANHATPSFDTTCIVNGYYLGGKTCHLPSNFPFY